MLIIVQRQKLITEKSGCCSCCSVAKSCPILFDPMDGSTWGSSVLHYLLEFAQSHVHWVGDAIQPSHLLSPPSSPAVNLISIRKERRQSSFLDSFFFWHFHCQGRVCSLVRKLRSHKPPRAPPTNKKKNVHFVCLRRHGATCVRARTEGTEALSFDPLRSPVWWSYHHFSCSRNGVRGEVTSNLESCSQTQSLSCIHPLVLLALEHLLRQTTTLIKSSSSKPVLQSHRSVDWCYHWYQKMVGVEKKMAGKGRWCNTFTGCSNEVMERLQLLVQVITLRRTVYIRMEGKNWGAEELKKPSRPGSLENHLCINWNSQDLRQEHH